MVKKRKIQKISFAIPAKIVLCIIVFMIAIGMVLAFALTSLTETLVNKQTQLLANKNAEVAANYLETMQTQSSSLVSELSRYHTLDRSTAEPLIKESLYSILNDSRVFSTYIGLEGNKYFPDTPNGCTYYAYHDGKSISFSTSDKFDSTSAAYQKTKSTMKAFIMDPYTIKLPNGETATLVTITQPILDQDGKCIGVANCDVKADTLNDLEYDLNNYKSAYSYILTNNLNYVTNTADKTLFGKPFTTNDSRISDAIANGTELRITAQNQAFGGDAYIIYEPLTIDGIDQHWSSAFVVNKAEAFAPVQQILVKALIIAVAGVAVLTLFSAILLKRALKPVDSIMVFSKELGEGNLSAELNVRVNNEFGEIASSLKNTANSLKLYIQDISTVLGAISECNLNVAVEGEFTGDFAPIKAAINKILGSLNDSMRRIESASDQVSAGASQISSGAQGVSQGAATQAASIEELSASIGEVSNGVQKNAGHVHEATNNVEQAVAGVDESNRNMQEMLKSMEAINESSKHISKIIKVIEDIAFQTNILSLNAAVEAARAGSAGKGFAVVADEVRNLASKSAEAAKQTNELIEGSIKTVMDGSRIAEETANSLQKVTEKSMLLKDNIENIDNASTEQATAISQITEEIETVSQVIQTNSAAAQESAALSEELLGQSQTLHNEVSKFKLSSVN